LEYFLFIEDIFNLNDEIGFASVNKGEQLVNTQRHSVWRVESRWSPRLSAAHVRPVQLDILERGLRICAKNCATFRNVV